MKKLIVVVIFGIFLFSSCKKSFDDSLASYLDHNFENCEKADSCYFDLKDFTEFQWDQMYRLHGLLLEEEIEELIGTKCNCGPLRSNQVRFIFLKEGEIVFTDTHFSVSTVFFKPFNEDKPIVYKKDQHKFYVVDQNQGPIEWVLIPKNR